MCPYIADYLINMDQAPSMPDKKHLPSKYPNGLSFWVNDADYRALALACDDAGLTVSAWLRQTVKIRLRHEGYLARPQPVGNGQHQQQHIAPNVVR